MYIVRLCASLTVAKYKTYTKTLKQCSLSLSQFLALAHALALVHDLGVVHVLTLVDIPTLIQVLTLVNILAHILFFSTKCP